VILERRQNLDDFAGEDEQGEDGGVH
jgi:hypothetical protein